MSPTYTFFCEGCKKASETFCSIKECPDFISCDGCGQPAQRQIVPNDNAGFLLKGTGWARDRYTGPSNRYYVGGEEEED